MPVPNLFPDARDFIMKMQPKHARQILMKLLEMCADPYPGDSRRIQGANSELWRCDSGEYRILYRVQEDALEVVLIGKRNDDEVYNEMRRRGL